MYTWQKSATQKGLFKGFKHLTRILFFPKNHLCCSGVIRECFSTSFKLGQRSQPVQVTPFCQLQRTQSDASSSIRACICTEDFCNDEPADSNQIGNPGNKTITDPLAEKFCFYKDLFVNDLQCLSKLLCCNLSTLAFSDFQFCARQFNPY